jgi:adenosylcobinamide-GDP ribazoletransferase
MVIASRALPYAREEGLASAFLPAAAAAHDPENRALPDSALADGALADGALADGALADSALADGALADSAGPDVALQAAVAAAGAALLLASLVAGRRGARAVVTGWISAALVLGMARRRLGGFTGDVLGAAGVVCETTGLLVAAAK